MIDNTRDTMVGLSFLSRDEANGKVEWQGEIVGEPSRGIFLIQLYSWIAGEPTDQRLVSIEDMRHWLFYDSAEDRNLAWTHRYAPRHAAKASKEAKVMSIDDVLDEVLGDC